MCSRERGEPGVGPDAGHASRSAGSGLRAARVPAPVPGPGQVKVKVQTCGICRTDLHVVDGELPHPKLPLIPGHQIVGTVEALGEGVTSPAVGEQVGIPWLGWTCGRCRYCLSGRENLCDSAKFTGYDLDGGFAEFAVADHRFAFPIPPGYPAAQAAPLLCAGLIGYRSLTMAGDAERLGLYGYGAAAHIVTQVARHQGRKVFAFTRPGDYTSQGFAKEMGARLGGRHRRGAPRGARRGHHLRACGRTGTGGSSSRRQGRGRRLRGDPHERHPVLPLRDPVGRAYPALGGQSDPTGRGRVSGPGSRGCRCAPKWSSSRSRRRMKLSSGFAGERSGGRPCSWWRAANE